MRVSNLVAMRIATHRQLRNPTRQEMSEKSMGILKNAFASSDNNGIVAAINRVQAVIEFSLDGRILHANENFLKTVGYSLDEIKGKHHAMFCDAAYAQSTEYKQFWEKLRRGEFDSGAYKRLGKAGKEVWIRASYNPV